MYQYIGVNFRCVTIWCRHIYYMYNLRVYRYIIYTYIYNKNVLINKLTKKKGCLAAHVSLLHTHWL